MNFLKQNKKATKYTVIGIGVLLLLFVLYFLILPMFGGDPYGDRLDGMGEVRINNDSMTRMKDEIGKDSKVESITYDLKGRIANIVIKVNTATTKEDALKIADKTLEYFTKGQKDYYDIQVYLVSDETNQNYPYIGYKHKTSQGFVWSNN